MAATKAFEDYQKEPEDAPGDEFYSKVDLAAVPGEVVWEKEISNAATVDMDETMALNWDEIVGPNRTGTLLVTGGVDRPGPAARNASARKRSSK